MKKWKKEFYQSNTGAPIVNAYACQCRAYAIYEETGNPKNGLYTAKLVEIQSDGDFKFRNVVGGDKYQHTIGEEVMLRQHKKHFFFSTPLWYNPKSPGCEQSENFIEITENNK